MYFFLFFFAFASLHSFYSCRLGLALTADECCLYPLTLVLLVTTFLFDFFLLLFVRIHRQRVQKWKIFFCLGARSISIFFLYRRNRRRSRRRFCCQKSWRRLNGIIIFFCWIHPFVCCRNSSSARINRAQNSTVQFGVCLSVCACRFYAVSVTFLVRRW